MSEQITSRSEIPKAPFYVVMRDKFLSGWGKAENQDAKYVAVCQSYEEAEVVETNAKARGDQDRVNIRSTKPNVSGCGIHWQLMTRETSKFWYEPHSW